MEFKLIEKTYRVSLLDGVGEVAYAEWVGMLGENDPEENRQGRLVLSNLLLSQALGTEGFSVSVPYNALKEMGCDWGGISSDGECSTLNFVATENQHILNVCTYIAGLFDLTISIESTESIVSL